MTELEAFAIESAWRIGHLRYKLRQHQLPLYGALRSGQSLIYVIRCARRFGKTLTVLLWILEEMIRRPGLIVRYAAPTEKSLKKYIFPNLRVLLADCPMELRPRYNSQESMFLLPNGSELHLAGTDKDHVEKLRGPRTDIGVCDEAGSMDKLRYVVNDVLMPSTLDAEPEGRLLIVSTPPVTPDHDFTEICREAQADGNLVQFTVEQNTWLQSRPALLAKYQKAMGGVASTSWRREMLCEDVVDELLAIVPEFTPEAKARAVVEWPRPAHWQAYETMDPGFSPSKCGVLGGYYDFLAAKLVIEWELELSKMRTDELALAVKGRELEHWGERAVGGKVDVQHRWSDIEPILLNDLQAMHGLAFAATSKDLLEVMVNKVRIWTQQDRLRIHPRCKSLIAQLEGGIFNNGRTEFAYSSRFGHYDLLAALVYMIRNCPEHLNPYPSIPDGMASQTHFIHPAMFKPQGNAGILGEMFKPVYKRRS